MSVTRGVVLRYTDPHACPSYTIYEYYEYLSRKFQEGDTQTRRQSQRMSQRLDATRQHIRKHEAERRAAKKAAKERADEEARAVLRSLAPPIAYV